MLTRSMSSTLVPYTMMEILDDPSRDGVSDHVGYLRYTSTDVSAREQVST